MKKIALIILVVSNGLMAQQATNWKQDIFSALDTVGIHNIVSPHAELDAAAAYIAKLKIKNLQGDIDEKAVSDSFNINVFRFFIYGFQYWSPELWEIQLTNMIRRHAPIHETVIHPTFMSVAIDEFEGGFGNQIVIIAYGTKDAICGLPKRD